MANLNSSLNSITGVGEKTGSLLKKLGLSTVSDLLFYFPFRYEDYGSQRDIKGLEIGEMVKVEGIIELIENRKAKNRKLWITEAMLSDGDESLKIIWFNQPFLAKNIKIGDKLTLSGKIAENYGQLVMTSPEYEKVQSDLHQKDSAALTPVYSLTEGKLSQKQFRNIIKKILSFASDLKEWLPQEISQELNLIPLSEAILKIHFPQSQEEILQAKKRLAFSNLFLRQLKSQSIKQALKDKSAPGIIFQQEETKKFISSLNFKLTDAQKKSAWEILKDLAEEHPMSRLLEGDVGSGKTIVAAIAMLNVALNKKRAALMAPSEILAYQHFQTISKLFNKLNIKVALKTRSYKLEDANKADIIIGTQALIQSQSVLKNLALVIVDEQHRFGVNQRKKIIDLNKEANLSPHFLSLSATPIPRSLSLAIYGDLDLSILDELPPGRKKTQTRVVKEDDRQKAYNFIKEKIKQGRQAFFVYPLISSSEKISFKSVQEEYENISKQDFSEFKVALIHGKLKKQEKEKIMTDFSLGKTDILMATSVIEVGIDIPNATVIMIEGADRFGLAQLHQLRGRVNRSDLESFCFLFPSKENIKNEKTKSRLKALEDHYQGLELAKIDLKLRGGGEAFGSLQSGWSDLSALSLFDYEVIKKSRDLAIKILKAGLKNYPIIQRKLTGFNEDLHLE